MSPQQCRSRADRPPLKGIPAGTSHDGRVLHEALIGGPDEEQIRVDTRVLRTKACRGRYRYSAWTSALETELEDVFVVQEAQRRGVALRLVEFAIARATVKGCRSVGLNANKRNANALALYGRCGFAAERTLWSGGRQLWLQRQIEMA